MEAVRAPLRAAGRVALAAMFISGGADALLDPGPRTAKAEELGVPLDPELAVQANGAAMLAAGAALALGIRPRLAAAVLAGSLVPTTLAGHPYWQVEDPAARRQQRIHFFKNVGLFGGALLVLSERPRPDPPGGDDRLDVERRQVERGTGGRLPVPLDDPGVDAVHDPPHLGLRAGPGRGLQRLLGLLAQRDRRRQVGEVLAPQLLLDPPQLVVRLVQVLDGLAGPGQVVELAPFRGLPDLPFDPGLEPDPGRLALAHDPSLRAARGAGRQGCGWVMLTIQGMPNRSTHMPNSSPHICFSRGMVTVPPSDSFDQ